MNLFQVDDWCRYQFFKKISSGIDSDYLFITHRYGIYVRLKLKKEKVLLIKKNINIEKMSDVETQDTKAEWLSRYDANIFINSLFYSIDNIDDKISIIHIWNGSRTFDHALKMYARLNEIKTIFYENANFDKRIIADPYGVNAKSKLFLDNEYLKIIANNKIDTKHDFDDYLNWKKKYINSKINSHIVKQANLKLSLIDRFFYFIDKLAFIFNVTPKTEKILNLKARFYKLILDKSCLKEGKIGKSKYLFFPLQVSTDSQLLLNSRYDNISALKYANELSKKEDMKLVIKLHPAEKDVNQLSEIKEIIKDKNIILSNENTFKLIECADKVITINSTVGLEAKLMGKKVLTLGDCFYDKYNDIDIYHYIFSYLIKADYFGSEKISAESINEIFSRVKNEN